MSLATDYVGYDALGLAGLIARREIHPGELLEAVRARAALLNPRLNAFTQLLFDRAAGELESGIPAGPLHGVPFALKDLGHSLRGTATASGGRLWRDHVAQHDSTLVQRYRRAGLSIVGKTATPELGLTFTTESAAYGQTLNPWDPQRTAGGSSGGAAAAVAARIVPVAHASDGGGSIRVPASCCGVFGLKPTRGRVPLGPAQFEGWAGLSVHHVISVSVRDSAAMLDATCGAEPGSPFFSPRPATSFLGDVRADPGRLRIALVIEPSGGGEVDDECRRAVLDAARLCESLGHTVDECTLPIDIERLRDAFATIVNVSVARAMDEAAAARGQPVTSSDVEPITWFLADRGRRVSGVGHATAVAVTHQIGRELARFQEEIDVILSPTLAQLPVPLGTLSLSSTDPRAFGLAIRRFSPYTNLFNVTGQPSMSVPLYWTAAGIPVGVMFSARFGDDSTLFRLAGQLEQARPWAPRLPPM